ncbi:MAG: AzlD domain-containing protein [Acetatifactor sp.]
MSVYLYILVMAAVTYLIRLLPLTLIRRPIQNRFLKSFLYYVPYACLMAMTFPAVFYATDHPAAAVAGVAVATVLALRKKGLVAVAVAASVTVFLVARVLELL